MRAYILLIILTTFIIGCTEKTSNINENEPVPLTTVESKEKLIERGNKIASELDSMLNDLGVETGSTPTISIRYEPYVIFFNPENNEVITLMYDQVPEELMSFFTTLSEQTDMGEEEFFESFFNTFFYVHEFGHWAQLQMDSTFNINRYQSEQEANEITVSYLESFDEGVQFLDYISPKVESLVAFLDNPVPEGITEEEYFNENYSQLGLDPYAYGYFQFKFVQNALQKRDVITLEEVVSRRN